MGLNSRGVTLVELIAAMTITVIITSAAYGLYGYFIKTIHTSSQYGETEQSTYRKIEMITSKFRRSDAVLSLSPEEFSLRTSRGDTVQYQYIEDSLYIVKEDEDNALWMIIDSLTFKVPKDKKGWLNCNISAQYPGRFDNFHRVSRSVVIFLEEATLEEDDWGFFD